MVDRSNSLAQSQSSMKSGGVSMSVISKQAKLPPIIGTRDFFEDDFIAIYSLKKDKNEEEKYNS